MPLRKIRDNTSVDPSDSAIDPAYDDSLRRKDTRAPSRIGQIRPMALPLPAAHRTPASIRSTASARSRNSIRARPNEAAAGPRQPPRVESKLPLRLSIPPSESANKTPLPPAMAGTVVGQPQRKRLKVDDDPFGAVGDYAGSFLIKSAVELSGGYDTNPGRLPTESNGLPFWWSRRNFSPSPIGSATRWSPISGIVHRLWRQPSSHRRWPASPSPTNIDRPNFNGHVDGRLDVTENTHLTAQARLLVSTDNPAAEHRGRPRQISGLCVIRRHFRPRPEIQSPGDLGRRHVDRTVYQESTFTDGTTSSNDDRNFNQYGGVGRAVTADAGVKPFVEVEGDSRVHDLPLDLNGFARIPPAAMPRAAPPSNSRGC